MNVNVGKNNTRREKRKRKETFIVTTLKEFHFTFVHEGGIKFFVIFDLYPFNFHVIFGRSKDLFNTNRKSILEDRQRDADIN